MILLVLSAGAAEKVRVAADKFGGEPIVYTHDATEFGADPSGQQDSTAAINDALKAAREVQGGIVFLPSGRYRISDTLKVSGGVTLRGEWRHPGQGGLGKGTILATTAGRDAEKPTDHPTVSVHSGACLRDVGIWYPHQNPREPVKYSAAVAGDGHAMVVEVTLYNAWIGHYNNSCSSMLVRDLHGTVLSCGIHGAYAYDIPRIEHVSFDPKYWAMSGLPNAPKSVAYDALVKWLDANFVGVVAGEQDWGYWWDIAVNHAKWGIHLVAGLDNEGKKMVPGNIAAGKVKMRKVTHGFQFENVGYPGFQLTFGEIESRECGMYYTPRPDYLDTYKQQGVNTPYYKNASIVVSSVAFVGGKYGFLSEQDSGHYNLNFNDCVFRGQSQSAISQPVGSLTVSNSKFENRVAACRLGEKLDQAVLTGNTWGKGPVAVAGGPTSVSAAKGAVATERDPPVSVDISNSDQRIFRKDSEKSILKASKYDFTGIPAPAKPVRARVFDATDYGARAGTPREIPEIDSTGAIQKALDAAGAARGGIVYVPGGVYRIDGGLKVPSGVVLQGSFTSQHYGNSTDRGTQFYAYGGKGREQGEPLVTLAQGATCRGFSVFYPEQGITDDPDEPARAQVKPYPPTIRTAADCRVENLSLVGAWTAIDALTVKSDNLIISDVTGAALGTCLALGHGMKGGIVRDLHFNLSGWTHQGIYRGVFSGPHKTKKEIPEYSTRKTKGLVLGDARQVTFFSCFNILVAEQVVLERDPYTGGSFAGKMWGVAFDAAGQGIVGRAGCEARLGIIASMGVFNQNGGGYYIKTEPGFKGAVALFNADVWSDKSRLADIAGGRAYFTQLFSWCCALGVCHAGGQLNVQGSVMVSNNGDNDRGDKVDFTYESGSAGSVVGTCDCRKLLHLVIEPNAKVTQSNNGFLR